MTDDVKLTPTQLQILRNIRDHDDAGRGFSGGMSQSGGVMRSLMSLWGKGLVDSRTGKLTEAGAEALQAVEDRIRARRR